MRNASKTLSLSTTITVCNRTSPLKSGNPTLSVALLALFGAGMHAFQPRPTENDLRPTHLHRLVTSLQSGGSDIAPESGVLCTAGICAEDPDPVDASSTEVLQHQNQAQQGKQEQQQKVQPCSMN